MAEKAARYLAEVKGAKKELAEAKKSLSKAELRLKKAAELEKYIGPRALRY
jgi:hypothetical protein